jgi:hypothetical protein
VLWQQGHRAKPFRLGPKQRNADALSNSTESVEFQYSEKRRSICWLERHKTVVV